MTSLEQLPNELFIEIFRYLTDVDVIYAFSQLNRRFEALFKSHVQTIDFKSVSKAKFHAIIERYEMNRWRALRLSENDTTPGQIRLFCRLYPLDRYLSQLQSFSAVNMTMKYSRVFVLRLVSLDQLVYLEIGDICGENIQSFQLPSLKRLVVTACQHNAWMMNFPSLENLDYTVKYNCHSNQHLTLPTTLVQLKIACRPDWTEDSLRSSLRPLTRLTKLAVYGTDSGSSLSDGGKWEQLIQSSLPLLQCFQFCFITNHLYVESDIDRVIASFSTPFYLVEKRWFVQCDFDGQHRETSVLYSLPYAFAEMPIEISSSTTPSSISTCPKGDRSFGKVRTLLFKERCEMPVRELRTANILRLVLQIGLPSYWFCLLANLRHLTCQATVYQSSIGFIHFLKHTPALESLTLPMSVLSRLTDKFENTAVNNHLSRQIKSLTITSRYSHTDDLADITERELSSLVGIFGMTCEHLVLPLSLHRDTALPLLQRMKQLRSLHISYHPEGCDSRNTAAAWLEAMQRTADASDFIFVSNDSNIYAWFGKRP